MLTPFGSTAVALIVSVLVTGAAAAAEYVSDTTDRPAAGYVPDAETAIKIAVAVWEPIYGRQTVRRQKPIVATLRDGVWRVRGSLPRRGVIGGAAEADISKKDGRILRVIHTR